jgi:NADH-quinone oxidoreductase subunit C
VTTPTDADIVTPPGAHLPATEGPVVQRGMFGAEGSGDTSGFGGLVVRAGALTSTPKPWGTPHDELHAQLVAAYPGLAEGLEAAIVEYGEMTLHLSREHLIPTLRALRDDLRFELFGGVSGVDYPEDQSGRRLHAVYHLLSMTTQQRIRLEVAVADGDQHIPSAVEVYPSADWHEREVYDFFGIIFDGHPGLTRMFMPDDWEGHPQRKDYPLGGIDVTYHGATVPPPDQRRSYA